MATAPSDLRVEKTRTMSMIPGYPSLSDQARGVLKFLWRKSHVNDDWTKGGEISDAWDRWSIFPGTCILAMTLMVDTGRRKDRPGDTRLARGLRRDHRPDAPAEHQYAAWFDLVEQKGFDPNRGHYPYDYYDKNMPPGWAGVYNAPGYYGNGLATKVPPKEARRTSPYTQPHSPAVGRTYNPDPIYGNGGSYMMGKGYLLNIIALYEFVCAVPSTTNRLSWCTTTR